MKSIVFFWWSKLDEKEVWDINIFLDKLLPEVKDSIKSIIYGWWTDWVMWLVKNKVEEYDIELESYIMDKYKRDTDPKNAQYFIDDNKRIKAFYEWWTYFVWLPGWLWTITELFTIWNFIRASEESKQIFIPEFFRAFYNLLENLENSWMLADVDVDIFNRISSHEELIKKIRI